MNRQADGGDGEEQPAPSVAPSSGRNLVSRPSARGFEPAAAGLPPSQCSCRVDARTMPPPAPRCAASPGSRCCAGDGRDS